MEGMAEETLEEMMSEISSIRASMVQFISGFSIGADAQLNQAKIVSRVQSSLEKIANLSSNAQTVLPTSISEIFERIDRPTSYQNIEVAAQGYEHFGTGLDGMDSRVAELMQTAQQRIEAWNRLPKSLGLAANSFAKFRAQNFPTTAVKSKRPRITDDPDAELLPDSRSEMVATVAGRVAKLQRTGSNMKKGLVAAQIAQAKDSQLVNVVAPAEGVISVHLVKEGEIVRQGQSLMTITMNSLVHYVSALRRIPNISVLLERASPADLSSSTTNPKRFVLVIGVQGVLTARLSIRRFHPEDIETKSKTAAVSTPNTGAAGFGTPRPDTGRDGGALMSDTVEDMMHVDQHDSHDGGDGVLGSDKGQFSSGTGFLRIDAISISGITESLGPWDMSTHAIFRAINQEAYAVLHTLRSRTRSSSQEQVLSEFVIWLSHFRSLFSTKCIYCKKILIADSPTELGKHTYLPCAGRDIVTGAAYHPQCCPVRNTMDGSQTAMF